MRDNLTMFRTFGRSDYSPARNVRIRKDKFYLVRMQNTSRDQGDGYYLEPGEYTELVPGSDARARRDARLNHCNAVTEYTGPVYRVTLYQFSREHAPRIHYARSADDAAALVQQHNTARQAHAEACRKEANRLRARGEQQDHATARLMHQQWAADADRAAEMAEREPWPADVEQVR